MYIDSAIDFSTIFFKYIIYIASTGKGGCDDLRLDEGRDEDGHGLFKIHLLLTTESLNQDVR
jgi:hypothetical protein